MKPKYSEKTTYMYIPLVTDKNLYRTLVELPTRATKRCVTTVKNFKQTFDIYHVQLPNPVDERVSDCLKLHIMSRTSSFDEMMMMSTLY